MIGLFLLLSPAHAAEIDEGPSGTLVTIRPEEEEGERLVLLDAEGQEIEMPQDAPPLWGINPAAWREAVATVEELTPYKDLADKHLATLKRCQAQLDPTKSELSSCQGQSLVLQTELSELKVQRWRWLGVGVGSGLVLGAGTVVITSLMVGK